MTGGAPGAREDRARELRAAVGPLLVRLKELAVRGVIARESFLAATAGLDLDAEGLTRVEQALRGMGLRVTAARVASAGPVSRSVPVPVTRAAPVVAVPPAAPVVPAAPAVPVVPGTRAVPVPGGAVTPVAPAVPVVAVTPAVQVVPAPPRVARPTIAGPIRVADPIPDGDDSVRADAPAPEEAVVVGWRVETAAALARRYGAVGPALVRVVAGVARLCGLTAEEREQFSALLEPGPVPAADPASDDAHGENVPPPKADSEPLPTATADTDVQRHPRTAAELSHAVRAAERLLAEQRRSARPEHLRLLTDDEVTGLAVLMRGGPDRAGEPVTEAELAALEPGCLRRRAYEALVEHNTRLVHEVCKKYLDQGLEYEDLFHHGVLGLMHAVCKFDISLRNRLSTYAYAWLRQAMSRALDDFGSAIRIPVHFHEEMRKVATATARLREEGRAAAPGDVAVALNLTVTRVEEILRVSRVTDSLDRELFEGANLGDALSYERPVSGPEEVLSRQWSRDDVEQRLLDKLDTKSADIMRRRAGFVDGEKQTLEEIGAVYGVTRERIRQIESKAKKRLRAELTRLRDAPSDGHDEPLQPWDAAVASAPWTEEDAVDLPPGDLASAAGRYLGRLGRRGLRETVGADGALIIVAIAEGRLPENAVSRRLRRAILAPPVG